MGRTHPDDDRHRLRKTQTFAFVATKGDAYAPACALPGHEAVAMWDVRRMMHGGKPSMTVTH